MRLPVLALSPAATGTAASVPVRPLAERAGTSSVTVPAQRVGVAP